MFSYEDKDTGIFSNLHYCAFKQKLLIWIFLLKILFSLLSIFLSYLSLLLNSNKAYKIIIKAMLSMRKEHIALHITISVQQYLHDNNYTHNTSYSWWNMEKGEQPYKFTSRCCFCRGWQGKCQSSLYKILPASAKRLPRKCRGKIYFQILTLAFYLPRQKMLKFEVCIVMMRDFKK